MEMIVIGTGSSGNSYLLNESGDRLILDAGMSMKTLIQASGDIRGIVGCLVTHEHKDHASSAADMMRYGLDVYTTYGTAKAANLSGIRLHVVKTGIPFKKGNYTILPFPTQHDAQEPCGFLIRHNPTGNTILYATDTYYLKNTFPGVNFWLVECNYSDDLVREQAEKGMIEKMLLNRLRRSHMSLYRLKQTLAANDLSQTRKIVLLHLSDGRSDEIQMVSEITEQTGIETIAADAGMVIDLSLTPF